MRVAIVNDLKLAVKALSDVLATYGDCEVAWVAEDGAQAVARCAEDTPDLVLMDMIMPVMDGVESTRRIMQASPCPILVVTATVEGNLSKVYEALGAGALDAVDGPRYGPGGRLENTDALSRKIRTIRRLQGIPATAPTPVAPVVPSKSLPDTARPLLVLGASTGGPDALALVLSGLPESFDAPIVVVQHLDKQFVPGLVDWLRHHTHRAVEAIDAGRKPEPGSVLIANSDDHLVISTGGVLGYTAEPRGLVFRPSVDVFFESLAVNYRGHGVAVVLTGMGRDGAQGLLRLRERGWATIAQDEATSVVYGMPKAAKALGAAAQVLAVSDIASAIEQTWSRLPTCAEADRPGGAR